MGVGCLRMPLSGFFGTSFRELDDLSDKGGDGRVDEGRDIGAFKLLGVDVRPIGGFLRAGFNIGVLGGGWGVQRLGVVQQEDEAIGLRGVGARMRDTGEGEGE